MNDAIKLIGIVIVVIGFVMKFDTLATVVVAGLVTDLISGMSIMDILNTLGTAFLTNRTATLFILTLPVVGLCERMGLRDKAVDLIKGIKNATTGRLLVIWEGVRTVASAFSLRIGGHPQFIRPLINPMAQAAAIANMVILMKIQKIRSKVWLQLLKTMVTSLLRTVSWVLQEHYLLFQL